MTTRTSLALSFFVALLSLSIFADDASSMHGIRNKKCAPDAETAKMQVFDALRDSKGLCPNGLQPSQVDGWTCRKGGDCGKNLYRCNTQFNCSASAPTAPAAPATAPIPEATLTPQTLMPSSLPSTKP